MTWKLWLDDLHACRHTPDRHPPEGFVAAASSIDAASRVRELGMPEFIDFDFDLGHGDSAIILITWLRENYPDGPFPEYLVHSTYPGAAEMIHDAMKAWKAGR
jgi:hypothetical protein